jgi:uncharacterized membrane protein SpoIIM required for sporulation
VNTLKKNCFGIFFLVYVTVLPTGLFQLLASLILSLGEGFGCIWYSVKNNQKKKKQTNKQKQKQKKKQKKKTC